MARRKYRRQWQIHFPFWRVLLFRRKLCLLFFVSVFYGVTHIRYYFFNSFNVFDNFREDWSYFSILSLTVILEFLFSDGKCSPKGVLILLLHCVSIIFFFETLFLFFFLRILVINPISFFLTKWSSNNCYQVSSYFFSFL